MSRSGLSVRDLRRQWKPHKERLNRCHSEHPTNVRFHRATSWLQRAEQLSAENTDGDLLLMALWTGFNAMYGQWDNVKRQPVGDCECWSHFLDRILRLDDQNLIVDGLMENKSAVMSILEDEYLSRLFWESPCQKQVSLTKSALRQAPMWYYEGRWIMILQRTVERIYFLRCQIVHGASTHNSSLNRDAVKQCTQMMLKLIPVFLQVWIQRGATEDWGIMCYPPMRELDSTDSSGLTAGTH